MKMDERYDVICIGGGPTGLACAIEAERNGMRPLVIDKGALCNSLLNYPVNMTFFTTPERMEIGDIPMTISGGKATRVEALKYYRRTVEHYAIQTRLYEKVQRITGYDGEFVVRSYLVASDDHGATWLEPRDLTREVKRPVNVTTLASGPGLAIQLRHGPHAGRILFPFMKARMACGISMPHTATIGA